MKIEKTNDYVVRKDDLIPTRLMQRLKDPPCNTKPDTVKPHHVFGGAGLGLTQQMWDVLDPLFELEYMGAAEYEFGILPRALHTFSSQKLAAFPVVLKKRTVWVLCPEDICSAVESLLRHFEKHEPSTKAGALFNATLAGETQIKGWFELDNGFFVFVDEDMWTRTRNAFTQ